MRDYIEYFSCQLLLNPYFDTGMSCRRNGIRLSSMLCYAANNIAISGTTEPGK
jgi:hypothetical protein